MNRVTRLLALAGVGIGVAAGVAVGTSPAQAAGQSSTHTASVQTKAYWGDDDDYRLVGYFNSPVRCARVGRIGEIHGRWDDYACYRVRYGMGRGEWALVVSDDDDCDWNDYRNNRFYGNRPYFGNGGFFDN